MIFDSCACMDSSCCDNESFNESHIQEIAKTDTICDECGGIIKAGGQYSCFGWQQYEDDDWYFLFSCKLCDAVFRDFCDCGHGRVVGGLWDHMQESIGISGPDDTPDWDKDDEEMLRDSIEARRK